MSAMLPVLQSCECCICLAPLLPTPNDDHHGSSSQSSSQSGVVDPPCVLPCGHLFHIVCILRSLGMKKECPLCRKRCRDPHSQDSLGAFKSCHPDISSHFGTPPPLDVVPLCLSNASILESKATTAPTTTIDPNGEDVCDESTRRLDRRARHYVRNLTAKSNYYNERIARLQDRIAAKTGNVGALNLELASLAQLDKMLADFSASRSSASGAPRPSLLIRAGQAHQSLEQTHTQLTRVSEERKSLDAIIAKLERRISEKRERIGKGAIEPKDGFTSGLVRYGGGDDSSFGKQRVLEWLGPSTDSSSASAVDEGLGIPQRNR